MKREGKSRGKRICWRPPSGVNCEKGGRTSSQLGVISKMRPYRGMRPPRGEVRFIEKLEKKELRVRFLWSPRLKI